MVSSSVRWRCAASALLLASVASSSSALAMPRGTVPAVYALLERVLPGASPQFALSLLPSGADCAAGVPAPCYALADAPPPAAIAKLHHVDLHNKYTVQGLDLVELRAVWSCLPERFDNDGEEHKAGWRRKVLDRLRELVRQADAGTLAAPLARGVAGTLRPV